MYLGRRTWIVASARETVIIALEPHITAVLHPDTYLGSLVADCYFKDSHPTYTRPQLITYGEQVG